MCSVLFVCKRDNFYRGAYYYCKNNKKRGNRCNAIFAARLTAPGQPPATQLLRRFDAHHAVVHSKSTALCQDQTAHQNYRLLISDGIPAVLYDTVF